MVSLQTELLPQRLREHVPNLLLALLKHVAQLSKDDALRSSPLIRPQLGERHRDAQGGQGGETGSVSAFWGERVGVKTQKQGGVNVTDICKIRFLMSGTQCLVFARLLPGGAGARRGQAVAPPGHPARGKEKTAKKPGGRCHHDR